MPLHKTPRFLRALYPGLTWHKKTDKKEVFLTFDDGPIPELTPFVLDTLSKYGVKATFFCVGDNLRKHGDIAQRAVEEGHILANHTYNHLNGWKTNNIHYASNIEECATYLKPFSSNKMLFRPPYGMIKRSQIKEIGQNYEIVMWDVLTWDFSSKMTPEICLKNSLTATSDGSIILFHDNVKAEKNLHYTLPRYIDVLLSRGFLFSAL